MYKEKGLQKVFIDSNIVVDEKVVEIDLEEASVAEIVDDAVGDIVDKKTFEVDQSNYHRLLLHKLVVVVVELELVVVVLVLVVVVEVVGFVVEEEERYW